VLAGSGEEAFVAKLRKLSDDLKITDHVLWAGFLEGEDKIGRLGCCCRFRPASSYSENFGMAASKHLQRVCRRSISDQVGMAPQVREAGAGLVVPCEIPALTKALEDC